MKKIPTQYILTQKDMEEAINLWLNMRHLPAGETLSFKVSFKVKLKHSSPIGGLIGGQADWLATEEYSATAVQDV